GLVGAVAHLLGADLAARDGLAALLQCRLGLVLARSAGAQLARELLAGLAVGCELGLQRLDLPGNRLGGGLECGDEPLGLRAQRLVVGEPLALLRDPLRTRGALARGTLGQALLSRQRGLQLGPPA